LQDYQLMFKNIYGILHVRISNTNQKNR